MPPRVAVALLARLGPVDDSLVGDLLEEYRRGRSQRWFWWQTLTAIAVSVVRDLHAHKLRAARAVIVGWAALVVFLLVAGQPISRWSSGWLLDRLIALRYDAIAAGTDTFVMAWATSLHPLPAGCLALLLSGWIVTRLDRSHAAATLFAFTLTVLTVLAVPLFSTDLFLLLRSWRKIAIPLFAPSFMRVPIVGRIDFLLVPVLILLGGWYGTRRAPRALATVVLGACAAAAGAVADTTVRAQTKSALPAQGPPAVERVSRDCPQWRGPTRDGSACAFAVPKTWPDALTRRWKVDVGPGYATPLVVGSTVYVFARRDDRELLLALDADTGRERWQTGYAAPYTVASAAARHGAGPKATPLFHRGRLYTLGISGIVSAFDASNGALVWQKAADAEHPYFGTSVSPVGEGDLVIVHPGNYGMLTAFDAASGATRWTVADAGSTFASPIVVDIAGSRQVVSMTQKGIVGVSVTDGTVLWQHPWESRGTPTAITPLRYGSDTLIVGGQRMPLTALKPSKRSDGTWRVDVAWEAAEISLFMSNPVLIGDTLFGLSERSSGQFFALDAKTGKVLWLGPPREAANTAVVKAGDLLFLLNDDAELIVARNNRTAFEPLKRYTVAESATWAQPAISGNRLFIKDATSLALWTVD